LFEELRESAHLYLSVLIIITRLFESQLTIHDSIRTKISDSHVPTFKYILF